MKRITCKDKAEWLTHRPHGLYGSDAAAIAGETKWKNRMDVYLEKIEAKTGPDLSGNPKVQYGVDAEEPLRQMFALDFPNLEIYSVPWEILINDEHDFLRATVDGLLIDVEGSLGVLEIKTATIRDQDGWGEWDDKIPQNYYCQVLHYMLVTGAKFAWVKAYLRYDPYWTNGIPRAKVEHYRLDRVYLEDDIKILRDAEIKFWNEHVLPRNRPDSYVRLGGLYE